MKKRSASFQHAKRPETNAGSTKTLESLRRRLRKDRPMVSVTLRMPHDVIEELRRLAPALGFTGYQPLIRAYIDKALADTVDGDT